MGKYSSYSTPSDERNAGMLGNYGAVATTTRGMEILDRKGALQWQDSAAYNMTKLSLERERLLNEQVKADMANKAKMAELAGQYLGSWNNMLTASNNMLNSAAQSISDLMKQSISGNSAQISDVWSRIDAAIGDVEKGVVDYQQKYGGLETEAINTAISQLGSQKALTAQMQDLARADTEGAATRAKADVASEASAARSKMADELIALGVDPTSGAGRAMMRQSMDSEALSKVLAGNKARIDEKGRATAATLGALQAINPGEAAGIASNIAQGKRELMSDKNKLLIAGTDAQNKALDAQSRALSAKAGAASSLARIATAASDNAAQIGDFGAALLGASYS